MSAGSSALGVMFEMTADPSQATAAIQEFSVQADTATSALQDAVDALTASIGEMNGALAAAKIQHDEMGAAARTNAREHTEAREAIKGLGEDIDVKMPRFVTHYLTSLEGIAPVMAGAFSTIAVVGLIDVLENLDKKVGETINDITGFSKEHVSEWEKSVKGLDDAEMQLLKLHHDQREAALAGLEGMDLEHGKQRVAAEDLKEVTAALQLRTAAESNTQEELKKTQSLRAQLTLDNLTSAKGTSERAHKEEELNATLEKQGDIIQRLRALQISLGGEQAHLAVEAGVKQQEEDKKAVHQAEETATKQAEAVRRGQELAWRITEEFQHRKEEAEKQMWELLAKIDEEALKDEEKTTKKREELSKQLAKIQADSVKIEENAETQRVEQLKRNDAAIIGLIHKEVEAGKKAHEVAVKQMEEERDLGETVASALESIGGMYRKNADLKIAAIAAQAAVEMAYSIAQGLEALPTDPWAAAMYFAAAAEYGIAAGSQAAGAGGGGGGGGGGGRSGGGGGSVSNGASAAGSAVLAPGSRPSGAPQPVSVILVGSTADAGGRALLGSALNSYVREDGGQLMATHDGQGNRLGS